VLLPLAWLLRRRARVGLALVGLVLAARAEAGLLDSPLPSFDGGAPGIVVYRMGPVHYQAGHVDTVVKCDSTGEAQVQVAVEVFDETNARIGSVGRTVLAPGASISFVTAADAASGPRVVLQNLPPLDHGKLRVSATTGKLSCTAHNRIVGDDGSASESALELIKRVAP